MYVLMNFTAYAFLFAYKRLSVLTIYVIIKSKQLNKQVQHEE